MDFNPTLKSLSGAFASPRSGVAQDNLCSLPPRPSFFSDVSPAPSKTLLGSSRSSTIPETDLVNPESSEANKYVVNNELDQWCNNLLNYTETVFSVKQDNSPKYGVSKLEDQWCNKLPKYSEAVSSVKQDDSPKCGVSKLDQWCNKLLKYSEAVSSMKQDDSPKGTMQAEDEEQQKESKECVKVDRVGEAFVVEINCPCARNYRTLFSGCDCYYKLLQLTFTFFDHHH